MFIFIVSKYLIYPVEIKYRYHNMNMEALFRCDLYTDCVIASVNYE